MKKDDIEKNQNLLKLLQEDIPLLRIKAADRNKDSKGIEASNYAMSLRGIGILEYVLHHDINQFKASLVEAAKIRLDLLRRYESGEPIDKSYITMINYQSLFNALAAADFDLSYEIALIIGGRDKIEKAFDHPFDSAFGYTLKWFVLQDRQNMEHWLELFRETCMEKAPAGFAGYVELFEAILTNKSSESSDAVQVIIKGHEKMSKGRGIFALSDDKYLCIWGIGMVNLARNYGLDVPEVSPLIPSDLLIEVNHKKTKETKSTTLQDGQA